MQSKVSECSASSTLWKTEIIILGHHCKRQEREFSVGQRCGHGRILILHCSFCWNL